jgi:hypothetical protein
VGSVYDPVAGEYRAACWTLDSSTGTLTSTLHFLDGGSAAFDVNDAGEIVGELDGAAVYWRHRDAAAISDNFAGDALVAGGSFGGEVALARSWVVRSNPDGSLAVIDGPTTLDIGSGQGVNNGGLVCGHTAGEAALWDTLTGARQILDRSGTTITSGGRTTFSSAQANAINSAGLVAGYATAKATFLNPVAVVWPSPTESMVVLDKFLKGTSISELNFAWAVNDSGFMVGSGWDGQRGIAVGFLAIPGK